MLTVKVKYFSDQIDRLTYIDGKSDWIDLRASEDIEMKAGEFRLIPLGIAVRLPEGYDQERMDVFRQMQDFCNFTG